MSKKFILLGKKSFNLIPEFELIGGGFLLFPLKTVAELQGNINLSRQSIDMLAYIEVLQFISLSSDLKQRYPVPYSTAIFYSKYASNNVRSAVLIYKEMNEADYEIRGIGSAN